MRCSEATAARPSGQAGRAKVNRAVNTDIVSENLRRDYERGCFWAVVAMLAIWGPLLVAYEMGVF